MMTPMSEGGIRVVSETVEPELVPSEDVGPSPAEVLAELLQLLPHGLFLLGAGTVGALVHGALGYKDEDLPVVLPAGASPPLDGPYLGRYRFIEYHRVRAGDVETLLPDGCGHHDVVL